MPQMDLSIIIVTYSSDNNLKNCLKSILEYEPKISYELILVFNGPTNFALDEVYVNHPKLIKNQSNLGFAAANNQGLAKAKGKYILFLNDDTIFTKDILTPLFGIAESLLGDFCIGCKLLNQDGSLQHSLVEFPSLMNILTESFFLYKLFPRSKYFNKYALNYKEYDKLSETEIILGAFMFCKTDTIRKLAGFDERFYFYAEEWDLCKRIYDIGGKVYYEPHLEIIHIGGATTSKNLQFKFKHQSISKIQYFQKHFNYRTRLLAITIHYLGIVIRIPTYFLGAVIFWRKILLRKSYYYLLQMFYFPKNDF